MVQSVLTGGNYVRSVKGMFLLCEAMEMFQFSEFFKENKPSKYKKELKTLKKRKSGREGQGKSRDILKELQNCEGSLIISLFAMI